MDIIQIIVLALLQGITEFLPVSSSAHLILPKELLGWPDQGLAFDVAVHVGTLSAVVMYFRREVGSLFAGWLGSLTGQGPSDDGRLAWAIIFATIPAGLCGLLFGDIIEGHLRSMAVIAATTIIFGLLLAFADLRCEHRQQLSAMTWKFAIVIGCAQAIALIPGTSRSGITITAALLLGFGRNDAARFSFLMSIPVILLSGGYKTVTLLGEDTSHWLDMALGMLISGVSAYLCIHYFLSFINRLGMLPFVYYRLALGAVLIAIMIFVP